MPADHDHLSAVLDPGKDLVDQASEVLVFDMVLQLDAEGCGERFHRFDGADRSLRASCRVNEVRSAECPWNVGRQTLRALHPLLREVNVVGPTRLLGVAEEQNARRAPVGMVGRCYLAAAAPSFPDCG